MAWNVDFGGPMMPRDSEGDELSQGSPAQGGDGAAAGDGIPDAPEGNPTFDASAADDGTQRPRARSSADFWEVLYGGAPSEVPDHPWTRAGGPVMHADLGAQLVQLSMWDLVAVTDLGVNATSRGSPRRWRTPRQHRHQLRPRLLRGGLGQHPVGPALIQNMSLAAHALGLGTFWITQTGGAEEVREVVGLPYDRMVIAVLALGHPKVTPPRTEARPLDQVTHRDHYAGRPIPSPFARRLGRPPRDVPARGF